MPEPTTELCCIVVADSEVIVRNVLSDYLRHCGYKVVDAASSDEVLAIFANGSATVTLVLSDADLGGTMNAFSLRLWVRKHWPDTQFILAGNVTSAAKAAGHICDEGPHLKRPYDPQAVITHIKRLLAAARR
jgi:DNA-binding NtrC family response regulator